MMKEEVEPRSKQGEDGPLSKSSLKYHTFDKLTTGLGNPFKMKVLSKFEIPPPLHLGNPLVHNILLNLMAGR